MSNHNEFGKEGEKLAVQFLKDNGYTIKRLNYRYLKAEVDIIAQQQHTLAIIEVKSRSSEALQNIADTVTAKKIKLLVMAADHYVADNDLDVEVRFDIITILKNADNLKIEHLKDAFYHF
ncbi:YraN family protein [Cellulophaga omnivescoria]|uniref:YraN family protein n=1 Tax=Cellulophaga omnivescoria TaxID=1888890 RepID=UPI0009855EDD|nr:YraN family protein [Cellulophaga omnivescoria]WBU87922.1 YraN family protein [Cellulophaga omnivescoria]WKB79913.1 YraN family protein [Cellulophaga lytica]